METGYRRRIIIEPAPGVATAELEDDCHRMAVRLHHEGGVIRRVECDMKRSPWSTCDGAMQALVDTFTGVAIADAARRGERTSNCTHLHDLTLFAAAHAAEKTRVCYDIFVSDIEDGRREARLARDGAILFVWTLQDGRFAAPQELAGRTIMELGDWVAAQDKAGAEAARILRWATILAGGREHDIPAGSSAMVFPLGACHTFQLERARVATRRADAEIDFSAPGMQPLADRADMFAGS